MTSRGFWGFDRSQGSLFPEITVTLLFLKCSGRFDFANYEINLILENFKFQPNLTQVWKILIEEFERD